MYCAIQYHQLIRHCNWYCKFIGTGEVLLPVSEICIIESLHKIDVQYFQCDFVECSVELMTSKASSWVAVNEIPVNFKSMRQWNVGSIPVPKAKISVAKKNGLKRSAIDMVCLGG
jgi:hypothetical protein